MELAECPPECQKDREALHKKADDRIPLGMFKWLMGLLVIILLAVCGFLWRGQMNNAERITNLHARLTAELSSLRSDLGKEISDLTRIVVRIDERTRMHLERMHTIPEDDGDFQRGKVKKRE